MEGRGIDFSDESPVPYYEEDNDAMSEGSSECPGEYYCWHDSENPVGTVELQREKRSREECLDWNYCYSVERKARRRREKEMRKRSMEDQVPLSDQTLRTERLRPEPRRDPWSRKARRHM